MSTKYNKDNACNSKVDNSDLIFIKNEYKTRNRINRFLNLFLTIIILFSEIVTPYSVFAIDSSNMNSKIGTFSKNFSELNFPKKPSKDDTDTTKKNEEKKVLEEIDKVVLQLNDVSKGLNQVKGTFENDYNSKKTKIKSSTQAAGGQTLPDDEILEIMAKNQGEEYGDLVNAALAYSTGKYALSMGTAWLKDIESKYPEAFASRKTPISEAYKNIVNTKEQDADIITKFYKKMTKEMGEEKPFTATVTDNSSAISFKDVQGNMTSFENTFRSFIDLNSKFGGGQIKTDEESTTSSTFDDPALQKKSEEEKQKRIEQSKKQNGSMTQEELNKMLLKNKKYYDERLNLYSNYEELLKSLSSLGKKNDSLGIDTQKLDSLTSDMDVLANQNKKLIDEAGNAATGNLSEGDGSSNSIENMGSSYYNIMPDIFDDSTKQLNASFQGLFAWTANFTPFVTNVYDSDIKSRLNESEEELYDKYSGKRSVVYMAIGEKGIAKGIRSGMPYQYKPISLAEFLDRADEKETVLFTKVQTFEVDVDEEEESPSTIKKSKMASTGDADNISADNTEETDSVKKDPSDTTEAQKAAAVEGTAKKTKTMASMPWKIVNGSVTDTSKDTNDPKPVGFIGPIYASSGKSYKEPWSLDDLGTSQIKTLLNQADPKLVENIIDDDKKKEQDDLAPENENLTKDKSNDPNNYSIVEGQASAYSKEGAGGKAMKDGSTPQRGYIAIQKKLWDQYKFRTFWIDGYGYGEVRDTMGNSERTFDLLFNTEAEAKQWGVKDVKAKLMPEGFKAKELGNPNLQASSIEPTPKLNDVEKPIAAENRISKDEVNTMKKMMFEGVKETKLEDASIARFLGNNMNMNYFLLHNNLMNKNQYSSVLEEDMNKPLYVDFIGNILTQSGYVVIPAAANYNYYNSPLELPMFNAAFLNSYPDLRLDETQQFTNTNNLEKRKFIYQKNKQGLVTISQLMRSGTSQSDEFYAVPLQSRSRLTNSQKDINLMDEVLMFKPNVVGYASTNDPKDSSQNLVFVNTGAIIQKLSVGKDNIVNLKNISGNGAGVDWDVIKQINQAHIDVEKSKILNQELLASNAVTTELTNEGVQSKTITDYVSKDEQLRTGNSIIKVVGELFESLTMRIFALLPSNYVLYTPSPENMVLVPNLARFGQKAMFIVAMVAFIAYLFRFVWNIFTRNDFGIKSSFISLLAIIGISAASLWILPFVINLLYNKPANKILQKDIPIFVMEGIEQRYREESPMFFDTTGNTQVESNPSITLERLTPRDAEYIRNETTQTPIEKTQFYMPTFDNTKVNVLGDKVYMQGRELKIDVKDLFDIVRIEDVAVGNNIKLEFKYSGYGEISNYMPFMQITEALTESINEYNYRTKSPYRLIQYRKGLTKSTGRTEDFVKSIAFIAPDLVDEFLKDLSEEYRKNTDTMETYYNNYTMPEEIENLNKYSEEASNLEKEATKVNMDSRWGRVEGKIAQNELAEKYKDISMLVDSIDYINMKGDTYEKDWLQLRKVLMRPNSNYDTLFDKDLYKKMQNAKWFPKYDANQAEDVVSKEIDRRIYIVNENTRRFVIDKMLPIIGHISDDTAIKMISMYATMEFDKEFKDFTDSKLYPIHYNTESISNLYTSKASLIPSDEIFITGVNKLSLYLARESGVVGLILALIGQVCLFIRMIIRIVILTFVILTFAFVLLYQYTVGSGKKSMYLQGVGSSLFVFSVLYIIELFWYRASFYLTNNIGSLESMVVGLIPTLFITYIYIKLLLMIVSDIRNFGYSKFEANVTGMLGGFYGIDMRSAYSDPMNDVIADYYGGGFDDYDSGIQMDTSYGSSGSSYDYMGNSMQSFANNPYMAADNFSFGEEIANSVTNNGMYNNYDDVMSGNGISEDNSRNESQPQQTTGNFNDSNVIQGTNTINNSTNFGESPEDSSENVAQITQDFVNQKKNNLVNDTRGVWGQRNEDLGIQGTVTSSNNSQQEPSKINQSEVERIFNEQTLQELTNMEDQLENRTNSRKSNQEPEITKWTEDSGTNFLH